MAEVPVGEAMSREGKGTDSESEEGRSRPLSWSDLEPKLAKGGWFWLATVRSDGSPHVMPVFAAWAGTSFFIASKDRARKSRNLEAEPRCVITTDTGDLHVIVEGTAEHVRDETALQRAVSAFDAVYRWPTRIDGDHLDADYGAPTSGGPPYEVYEVTPTKAFALPTDGESTTPTRWVWQRNERHLQGG